MKLRKDGDGRVVSPLKFLAKLKPGGVGTPESGASYTVRAGPDGRARRPQKRKHREEGFYVG